MPGLDMPLQPSPSLLVLSAYRRDPLVSVLTLSLVVHAALLMLGAGLRVSAVERPLSSYQVSLVSLEPPARHPAAPAPPPIVEAPAPAKAESAPVLVKVKPAPAPRKADPTLAPASVVKPAPPRAMPVPPVTRTDPAPPAPARPARVPRQAVTTEAGRSRNLVQDVLREIALPPDAPELGDIAPAEPVAPARRAETSRKEIQKLLGALTVPEARPVKPVVPKPAVVPEPPGPRVRPRAAEDLDKLLAKMRQPAAPPPEPAPRPAEPLRKARAVPAPAAPVDAQLRVQGASMGSNEYLARVQTRISEQWVAPPVDLQAAALQVVIRFRLHRSGTVTGVQVEQSSGNGYYDDAGRRAVQAADPLPPFPSYMKESSLDAHFTFTVGQQAG